MRDIYINSNLQPLTKSMETETTTWSEFPNKGTAIVEQIIASEERNQEEKDCESHSQGSK